MLKELAEVWRFRELLWNLVRRDIRVRYKNSVLGFFWSLVIPLSQVLILTVVVKYIWGVKIGNYSAYLFAGILPFTFFSQSIMESSTSIVSHAGLVKKTYFPREIIPLAIVISNLVHLVLAMVGFFLYWIVLGLFFGYPPVMATWLLLPVVMLINFMLCMGLSFFLVCLNTYYEDVKYVISVGLNLMFYALPILYLVEIPLKQVEPHHNLVPIVHAYFNLNPLAYLITTYRKILLPPFYGVAGGIEVSDIPLDYRYVVLAGLISFIILVAGYAYFNKRKWHFAERL